MAAFYCNWALDTLVVTSDGTVVCGCADPYNERPVGTLESQSLQEIWVGEPMKEVRQALRQGKPGKICLDCGLGQEVPETFSVPPTPEGPRRLLVEPTIICNLRCPIESCEVNNSTPPRKRNFLDVEQFQRMVDEAGPTLERIQFYNYGEAFIHRGTISMIRYVKKHFPHVWVDTSTNGHFFFNEARRREVVESGIDRLIFSVDGAFQETYERYRRGGHLQKVLDAMAGILRIREEEGSRKPEIMWRYILLSWNDSDREMNRARQLAREMGVDTLCWHLSLPVEGASKKYRPDSRATRKIWPEFFESGPWPNALPERRTSERPSVLKAKIRPRGLRRARVGQKLQWKVRVKNTGDSLWLSQSRPDGGFVTLGLQVFPEDAPHTPCWEGRAHLPQDVAPGEKVSLSVEIPVPSQAGRYRLKLDLVNELRAWFGDLGSPTWESSLKVHN